MLSAQKMKNNYEWAPKIHEIFKNQVNFRHKKYQKPFNINATRLGKPIKVYNTKNVFLGRWKKICRQRLLRRSTEPIIGLLVSIQLKITTNIADCEFAVPFKTKGSLIFPSVARKLWQLALDAVTGNGS